MTVKSFYNKDSLVKIFRFIKIYGFLRATVKVFGRMRPNISFKLLFYMFNPLRKKIKVGIIGCGQFPYSTSIYYLTRFSKAKLIWCYDINYEAAKSLAKFYGINNFSDKNDIMDIDVDLVYIASNHASHTSYAIKFLNKKTDVYIEKPISTDFKQLNELDILYTKSSNNLYCGYNRPHSPAIKTMLKYIDRKEYPFTFSCFIVGHFLPDDHWYRDSKEGNRICGNLGHWIDLFVHLLFIRGVKVSDIDISISYSDIDSPSENLIVTFTTPLKDLATITFSARGEPFEGVSETINIQQNDLLCKIHDFRLIEIWNAEKYYKKRFWNKEVGHKNAILQPFKVETSRKWLELNTSTKLMLEVSKMVDMNENHKKLKIEM